MHCVEIRDEQYFEGKYWKFFHRDGFIAAENLILEKKGLVTGYNHFNERTWSLEGATIRLYDGNGEKTSALTFDAMIDGKALFVGRSLKKPSVVLCLQEQIGRTSDSRLKKFFKAEIQDLGWEIGEHSYGSPIIFEKEMAKLIIGKFCSIAPGVKIALGNHRTDAVTSYPFVVLKRYWGVADDLKDHVTRGDVCIGNDVWIGADAFIFSGIKVGDGAVIGAGSMVTRDVPPYSVVAGNPANIVRFRFEQAVIDLLLSLKWWDLHDDTVGALIPLLLSSNPDKLIAKIQSIQLEVNRK